MKHLKHPRWFLVVVLCSFVSGSFTSTGLAENWPEWRGPSRNGVSHETGLPSKWGSESGIHWKAKLTGNGVSSPVIWEDRIFLTAADGPSQQDLRIICLSTNDGSMLWELRLWGTSPTLHHTSKSDMATPTPMTDGKFVYAFFGTGDVFCVDANGGLVWQRSL
ncbi:MAG: hypothetical protein FJ267_09140, partial [Planctomycetes bacterium]|nr:hypothetical protein [Planctomycetota bacterium]